MSLIAIGPSSKNHGEAKMFQHSCSILKENFDLIVIDSTAAKLKYLRPWYVIWYLCYFTCKNNISHIYLSYSRNKYMLLMFLPVLILVKFVSKSKCIFHIHDTSLKKNLTGFWGIVVKILYSSCIDFTILPNKSLEKYSRIEAKSKLIFLLNPYLGQVAKKEKYKLNKFHFISYPEKFKNLNIVIDLINKAKLELEVIGWTESDFKRLYPNFDKDLSRVNFLGKKSHEYTLKRLGVSDGLI